MSWQKDLASTLGLGNEKLDLRPVGGGCINETWKLQTSQKSIFIKHKADAPKDFFEKEASGLKALAKTKAIKIPQILDLGPTHLALEWIETSLPNESFFEIFGRQLADLHRHSYKQWGFEENNFIGALPQANNFRSSFHEFFWSQRLEPQIQMSSLLSGRHLKDFAELQEKLDQLLNTPDEKPALIHGDLWSGNFMVDSQGNPVLIDPAVAYSHREMELAFTELFGGFSSSFYRSYDESFPLTPGYQQRRGLYNLYPLMVHVNLFGSSYLSQVENILGYFV